MLAGRLYQELSQRSLGNFPLSEQISGYWNRAGVAFENKDGSFTFKLDILPQTKFQLREERPLAKEEAATE